MSSKYPGSEMKTAHMVSFGLRPYVIAAWNSHCYKEYMITGLEPQEVMVEDWSTLSNSTVNQMLLEAARRRTKEWYARELILFLGNGILQTPLVNFQSYSTFLWSSPWMIYYIYMSYFPRRHQIQVTTNLKCLFLDMVLVIVMDIHEYGWYP